jgi:DNA (cytosine-5)-methyltransferase 1
MEKLKVLDLFSGIGGFSLGLERAGMETIAFCEIDPFCQRVLRKHWPSVPIYSDIKELNGNKLRTKPDVITGGYPCQPFSSAGKRRGSSDDRCLWGEFIRLISQCRPSWVIGENVVGHIHLELDNVLSELEGIGYSAETITIPACAVGRDHRRERVWVLAHPVSRIREVGRHSPGGWWEPKQIPWHGMGEEKAAPRVVGGFDGIPNGLDRIKALGNAVVPQIPEIIGRAILTIEREYGESIGVETKI